LHRRVDSTAGPIHGCIVGSVVEAADTGYLVDFPGNHGAPLVARSVLPGYELLRPKTPVLLAFEEGDPKRPIILGVSRATDRDAAQASSFDAESALVLSPDSLTVNARREIVLQCGRASVTLRADGTVVVRGTRLLSRASGVQRIKGAAVHIN